MEAAQDTNSLEAAIAWLVQTILATLLIDKLDAWIRQVGLVDDVEKLKSEIRRVEMVVGAVIGRAAENKPLARSLRRVKALLYEADDVANELDYHRLQHQMQGVTRDELQGMHEVERVDEMSRGDVDTTNSSVGKLRSVVWEHFKITEKDNGKPAKSVCRYCGKEFTCRTKNGTSSMNKHINKICTKKPRVPPPNPSSSGDATANATPIVIGDSSSRKRRRVDELAQTTASSSHTPWDKATLSSGIRKITSQLQEIRGELSEVLKLHGSDLASSSNHHRSAAFDQHLRTSSLVPRKVYGRVAEKDSIVKMITEERSDGVVVLPIVGIAGVGKTTLAQLVYNDPNVESQFDQRIWVWVSQNFDEVRLTREMLDSISRERHAEINCFGKLQEMLRSHANSKRFLLILDNVWDGMNDIRWDKVLAPLVSSHVNGNVILVTTRNMSVAQRLGTRKPVKLGALANDDFQLLFKSCAFGYQNYEEHQTISIIGQQIAEKLKGNPLAAVSTGELLRKKINTDYWRYVLKNEDWKSMQLSRGIMSALMLSYDQLPYHLQQCFSYCSIFPDSYQFLGEELVSFWIAQRFVKCNNSSQSLEGIGLCYLIDLVNLGFLQEVKKEESYLGSQNLYAVCGIMHDFAMMVSRDDCASIDGLQCNKMSETLRHLSIVTGSAYNEDQHGNIHRDEKFEENLRNAVTSVSKLRTLVLLGPYDFFFLLLFQDIFQKAHNLRVLQMSATSADFLKRGYDEVDWALPLSKLYHLQVLDVGSYTDHTIPDGIDNLVNLRHLVVHKGVYSAVATIDTMASFHELHGFKFQISSSFETAQSQTMSEFVQDSVHQLGNVKTLKEVYEAVLKKNELLEKLHLSWKESSAETGVELLRMNVSGPSFEPSMDTTREVVVEGLEPRLGVKILDIWYDGATSPLGLASNMEVFYVRELDLYGCGEWQIYPSLERFPFLTALKLSNLPNVTEVFMSSSLRVLQIEKCRALKVFDLLENNDESEMRPNSWLPCLRKLTLLDCPVLKVLNGLPLSDTFCELLISGIPTLPRMQGSVDADGKNLYTIGYFRENENLFDCSGGLFDESSDELTILDDKMLAFRNLGYLDLMRIDGCRNLTSISFQSFSQLSSLTRLELFRCDKLFASHVLREPTSEDMPAANCEVFPCLRTLDIKSCGISGKWLSRMLCHAPDLTTLRLNHCSHITLLSIEEEDEKENSPPNIITATEDSSSGNPDDAPTGLVRDELLHIPLNLLCSLKTIYIINCPRLTFKGSKQGFSAFTSLDNLAIYHCSDLLLSLVHKDRNDDLANGRCLLPASLAELEIGEYSYKTLEPCFPSGLTSLNKLLVWNSHDLESLQLQSCTALEELEIAYCGSLTGVEGLQSLGSLRHLTVYSCPGLSECLESFAGQGYGLCSRLETLKISDPSVLTTSFCKHLTSLQRLTLKYLVEVARLTYEEEMALVLTKSLQELEFSSCSNLVHLPAWLYLLPSLKRLEIRDCLGIPSLPESRLPLSLEELVIKGCRNELNDQCRLLATSYPKLKVKIDQD